MHLDDHGGEGQRPSPLFESSSFSRTFRSFEGVFASLPEWRIFLRDFWLFDNLGWSAKSPQHFHTSTDVR